METINKKKLILQIKNKLNIKQCTASCIVESFIALLIDHMKNHRRIELGSMGDLVHSYKTPRPVRDFTKGCEIMLSGRNTYTLVHGYCDEHKVDDEQLKSGIVTITGVSEAQACKVYDIFINNIRKVAENPSKVRIEIRGFGVFTSKLSGRSLSRLRFKRSNTIHNILNRELEMGQYTDEQLIEMTKDAMPIDCNVIIKHHCVGVPCDVPEGVRYVELYYYINGKQAGVRWEYHEGEQDVNTILLGISQGCERLIESALSSLTMPDS